MTSARWVLSTLVGLVAAMPLAAADAPGPSADGFRSPNLAAGQRWDLRIPEVGTYAYFCSPHPEMKGTIEVARGGNESSKAKVEIRGFRYQPAMVRVAPNGTVSFTNNDSVIHTVTESKRGDSGGTSGLGVAASIVAVAASAWVGRRR